VGNTEPHHHFSVKFNVGPSCFEDREAIEMRVVELVQFEGRKERQDSDHHGEALVALGVGREFIISVGGELLLSLDQGKLSFTYQLSLVFRKEGGLISSPVNTAEDNIEDHVASQYSSHEEGVNVNLREVAEECLSYRS
jgi:hypothetical protein